MVSSAEARFYGSLIGKPETVCLVYREAERVRKDEVETQLTAMIVLALFLLIAWVML